MRLRIVALAGTVGLAAALLSAPPAVAGVPLAVETVSSLAVKGRAPQTGYSRALFGPAWKDVDKNGCDTRNDILRRDLTSKTYKGRTCIVLTGVLVDPYSGARIAFKRGVATSRAVEIDHMVALDDAWQKGAQKWTAAKRLAFANDPLNLIATSGHLNQQKGAGDAATWLPPKTSFRCAYVARQAAVKSIYGLWVTAAEKASMQRILAKCPKLPTPTATQVAPPHR
jgi:Protein of unknown function (DUF1524)